MEDLLQEKINKYFDTDKIQIKVGYVKIRTYNIKIYINNEKIGEFEYQYEAHLAEKSNLLYIKWEIEMKILEFYRKNEEEK